MTTPDDIEMRGTDRMNEALEAALAARLEGLGEAPAMPAPTAFLAAVATRRRNRRLTRAAAWGTPVLVAVVVMIAVVVMSRKAEPGARELRAPLVNAPTIDMPTAGALNAAAREGRMEQVLAVPGNSGGQTPVPRAGDRALGEIEIRPEPVREGKNEGLAGQRPTGELPGGTPKPRER